MGFPLINHPAMGVPPFMETPIFIDIYWCICRESMCTYQASTLMAPRGASTVQVARCNAYFPEIQINLMRKLFQDGWVSEKRGWDDGTKFYGDFIGKMMIWYDFKVLFWLGCCRYPIFRQTHVPHKLGERYKPGTWFILVLACTKVDLQVKRSHKS